MLGLDFLARLTSCPAPNVYDASGGEVGWDTTLFGARGDTRFYIDHLNWTPGPPSQGGSKVMGMPYDIFRQPTHLGYVRVSLEVDDIDAAYRTLRRSGLSPNNGSRLRISGPPEEWDFGPVFGKRKVVVFTDPEGVGFELIQQAPYPLAVNTQPPVGGACGLGVDPNRGRQQVIQLKSASRDEAEAGVRRVTAGGGKRKLASEVRGRLDSIEWRLSVLEQRVGTGPDVRDLDREIAQVRRDKEAAVDAQDFENAAVLRDKERQLLSDKAAREQEWAALPSLSDEVERLRDLLRRHGIDPQNGAA